jgi:transcriptional regulator with XRE-family HTH domain
MMAAAVPSPPSLGEFVRRKRVRRGFSQVRLAFEVGVSDSYMQKIEQGVAVHLGDTVISSFVVHLELSPDEATHLRALAGGIEAEFLNVFAGQEVTRALLSALLPHPAARYSGWQVTAANAAFEVLWPGLAQAPSMLEWMITDPRARTVTPYWLEEATAMVAWFRGYAASPDPFARNTARDILCRLGEYQIFRVLWSTGLVRYARRDRLRRIRTRRGEVRVREILLPWPQEGAAFEYLFVGLIEQGESAVCRLLAR